MERKIFEKIKSLENSDGKYAIIVIDMNTGDLCIGSNKMNIPAISKALSIAVENMNKNNKTEYPSYLG